MRLVGLCLLFRLDGRFSCEPFKKCFNPTCNRRFPADSSCAEVPCLGNLCETRPRPGVAPAKPRARLGVDGVGFVLHIAKTGGTTVGLHLGSIFGRPTLPEVEIFGS